MKTARMYPTATLLPNGRVLVVGGFNKSSGALASAELYFPDGGASGPFSYFQTIRWRSGHTYAITNNSMTWDEARILAEQHGGYLVTINDSSENQFLSANYGSGVPWIGLNDIQNEGTWEWANGDLPTYWNWAPGEPSPGAEHCVMTN